MAIERLLTGNIGSQVKELMATEDIVIEAEEPEELPWFKRLLKTVKEKFTESEEDKRNRSPLLPSYERKKVFLGNYLSY